MRHKILLLICNFFNECAKLAKDYRGTEKLALSDNLMGLCPQKRGLALAVLFFLMISSHATLGALKKTTLIGVSSPSLYFSPYNTYSSGSGSLLANNVHKGSDYVLWVNPGAYFKTNFTGSSATVQIEINQSRVSQMPKVGWSIDGGPVKSERLLPGSREIQLASQLDARVHSVWFIYMASDANQDRWNEPIAALKIYGIVLNSGEGLRSPVGSIEIERSAFFFSETV
jgi:hypothetical protein